MFINETIIFTPKNIIIMQALAFLAKIYLVNMLLKSKCLLDIDGHIFKFIIAVVTLLPRLFVVSWETLHKPTTWIG